MASIAEEDITTDGAESNSKSKSAATRSGSDHANYGVGWNVVRTLGEGAYGEVKLVVDSQNPHNAVAMKVIDLAKHPDVVETVRKEALLMRMLRNHVNIIKYLDMRFEENLDEFQIFLEYADGGELFDQIEPDVGMPTQKAQFYFRQLIKGLEYIHSRGVAHRDIKPENLLLTKNDLLKISDFGMATVFRHNGRERLLDTRCGTLPYVAPEVLSQKYKAQPADVWSCGIVLVALLAGELAWDSPTGDCDAFNDWTESANLDANPWTKIGTVALSLLRAILNHNPLHRACIKRIQAHPWFTKDFSKERAHLSRTYSNGVANATGSGTLDRPAKRRKRSLNTVFEVLDGDQSVSQPVPGNNSVSSNDCGTDVGCPTACKRQRDGSTTPPNFANNSFSQPENVDSMLLSYSQIGCSQSQTP
uniref:non-specific serine/threonine protein kinase n=1 Tax=Plectus sambesii TaxID=2011161 RepID=A0A914VJE7_9BILA